MHNSYIPYITRDKVNRPKCFKAPLFTKHLVNNTSLIVVRNSPSRNIQWYNIIYIYIPNVRHNYKIDIGRTQSVFEKRCLTRANKIGKTIREIRIDSALARIRGR